MVIIHISFFVYYWIQPAKIVLRIFTSIFMKIIDVQFSFFVMLLCDFGIKVMLTP